MPLALPLRRQPSSVALSGHRLQAFSLTGCPITERAGGWEARRDFEPAPLTVPGQKLSLAADTVEAGQGLESHLLLCRSYTGQNKGDESGGYSGALNVLTAYTVAGSSRLTTARPLFPLRPSHSCPCPLCLECSPSHSPLCRVGFLLPFLYICVNVTSSERSSFTSLVCYTYNLKLSFLLM